ncbi:DUF3027 domain-containing protein [Herbiconiux sp.]|uniref:DUF3027 domain-containing protein n=1 Tax=Herbiconiux sp. TaxID=1871186 RepID=UPI0025C1B47E|nr:DUF3027 domain-containing protein [Herbiconiux sp.]
MPSDEVVPEQFEAEQPEAEQFEAEQPESEQIEAEQIEAEEAEPVREPLTDEVLLGSVEFARAALLEITPSVNIGPIVGSSAAEDHVLSLFFESKLPGYPGWHWTVTLARIDEDSEPSVLEVEMLPGENALIAPDWLPWSERLAEYQLAQELAAATASAEGDDDDHDDDDDDHDDEEHDDEDDLDDDTGLDLDDGIDIDDHVTDDDELEEAAAEDDSDDDDESDDDESDDDESDDDEETDQDDEDFYADGTDDDPHAEDYSAGR